MTTATPTTAMPTAESILSSAWWDGVSEEPTGAQTPVRVQVFVNAPCGDGRGGDMCLGMWEASAAVPIPRAGDGFMSRRGHCVPHKVVCVWWLYPAEPHGRDRRVDVEIHVETVPVSLWHRLLLALGIGWDRSAKDRAVEG